jgi:hypothetical protein
LHLWDPVGLPPGPGGGLLSNMDPATLDQLVSGDGLGRQASVSDLSSDMRRRLDGAQCEEEGAASDLSSEEAPEEDVDDYPPPEALEDTLRKSLHAMHISVPLEGSASGSGASSALSGTSARASGGNPSPVTEMPAPPGYELEEGEILEDVASSAPSVLHRPRALHPA